MTFKQSHFDFAVLLNKEFFLRSNVFSTHNWYCYYDKLDLNDVMLMLLGTNIFSVREKM